VRRREARAVEALVDAVAAPRPPLPTIADTDAVASFATWIACAPQPNRALLHAVLGALALTRFARRDRAGAARAGSRCCGASGAPRSRRACARPPR
jgi:hypothetical protein